MADRDNRRHSTQFFFFFFSGNCSLENGKHFWLASKFAALQIVIVACQSQSFQSFTVDKAAVELRVESTNRLLEGIRWVIG